jgi:hypothetical protein
LFFQKELLLYKFLLMKKLLFLISFFGVFQLVIAQQQEVPFTLADRDRIIQTEVRVSSLSNEMNSLRSEMNSLRSEMNSLRSVVDAKLETLNTKIDYMYWVQGVIIALIIFLLGFIIWDRRTAMTPIRSDVDVLKTENEKMKLIFRQLAETQPQIREIIKNAGIL